MRKHSWKLLDLFCGPGGISEGFRMAGIPTLFAVDHDKDACQTFAWNHPEATVVCEDVLNIDPASLPDTDIIVGGPPCVNFSTSKGSRANVLDGLRLVQWFLRVVWVKKPKFWIMENVPRVAQHIPDHIPLSWIGIEEDGLLDVPRRGVFNAADFGVPQNRSRYLLGNYPTPIPTHEAGSQGSDLFTRGSSLKPWQTLRQVVTALEARRSVTDPNYGFTISIEDLSDNNTVTQLAQEEAEDLRDAKQNHPYMGRMAFPDDLDRPARTVVATQLGRETLVLRSANGFRRATIRECATIQSFPITYQFIGNSVGSRYRQAGDAVAPMLAFSIAKQITGIEDPKVRNSVERLAPAVEGGFKRKKKVVKLNRTFAQMVPGKEVRGCRVELDNLNLSRNLEVPLARIWSSRIHFGEGKANARAYAISGDKLIVLLREIADHTPRELRLTLGEIATSAFEFASMLDVSPQSLQAAWAHSLGGDSCPKVVTCRMSSIVDNFLPPDLHSASRVALSAEIVGQPEKVRVRLLAGLVVTSIFCEMIEGSAAEKKRLKQCLDVFNSADAVSHARNVGS